MLKFLKSFFLFGFALTAIGFVANPVFAHQPRIVENGTVTQVPDVRISKAYYGVLKGAPAVFELAESEQFPLYVNMLVPDLEGSRIDFVTRIERIDVKGQSMTIAILDGTKSSWVKFHEDFANDDYLKGPEFRMQLPKGTYRIIVSNGSNEGAYALAIGETESFPVTEMLSTVGTLPEIKTMIFRKNPLSFLFSKIGAFLSIPLLLIIVSIFALRMLFLRRQRKRVQTQPNWRHWYDALHKPSWTPTGETISLIWTILYPFIVLSLVAVIAGAFQGVVPLWLAGIFVLNLIANVSFTPVQFGLRDLGLALAVIIIVLLTIFAEIVFSWQFSRLLAIAQVPYLIWVTIATVLQYSIYRLNRKR